MNENELRKLVREQIITRFMKKQRLAEQFEKSFDKSGDNKTDDDKSATTTKPTVAGSEKSEVKGFDPKTLATALGIDKQIDVTALKTAMTNAATGKRSANDNAILGDMLLALLNSTDKTKALSVLSRVKGTPAK